MLLIIPVSSAFDLHRDEDSVLYVESEMKQLDTNWEIITIVRDCAFTDAKLSGSFYVGSIEMWGYEGTFNLLGIKRFNGEPQGVIYSKEVVYLKAKLFIGILIQMMQGYEVVSGIAFGFIEWS